MDISREIIQLELEDVVDDRWVYDSSLDHRGDIPLRASTGAWKASLFLIAIEFSERLSYFGIATSLIIYLTIVLDQDLKTAAKSVNNWIGVTTVMPLLGGFIADACIGRFYTIIISFTIYIAGLILLTMTSVVPSLDPCHQDTREIHEMVFYIAIYMISIGSGGHKPSLESFGADQFDDDNEQERKKKMSFFNWWNSGVCCGLLLGVTLIVYIQDYVSWGAADIMITTVMILTLFIFILGMPFYRYRMPRGSPLTPMLQVIVAAFTKRSLPYPSSTDVLFEINDSKKQGRLVCHTPRLKFLDNAAIVVDNEIPAEEQSPWSLKTVTEVEEVKLIINMIPIWLSTLPLGICISQSSTFFIKQAATMNRHITRDITLPPATIYSFAPLGMIASVTLYEKLLVPILRHATGNERGITILQRIGIGMAFAIATMMTSALIEKNRLASVTELSVFWLAPQFFMVGFGDGFAVVGLQEYFYEEVPDSMRSLGIAFYLSVIGVANFLSSLLISVIDWVRSRSGASWFGKDLEHSSLDKFYWLLASIMVVNLAGFVYLAKRYQYKSVRSVHRIEASTLVDYYDYYQTYVGIYS